VKLLVVSPGAKVVDLRAARIADAHDRQGIVVLNRPDGLTILDGRVAAHTCEVDLEVFVQLRLGVGDDGDRDPSERLTGRNRDRAAAVGRQVIVVRDGRRVGTRAVGRCVVDRHRQRAYLIQPDLELEKGGDAA